LWGNGWLWIRARVISKVKFRGERQQVKKDQVKRSADVGSKTFPGGLKWIVATG
jgi:hypothetical protein